MADVHFIDLGDEIREDRRGFSFFPLQGRVGDLKGLAGAFHLVCVEAGQVRGNHLHPDHWEWLFPFHGTGFFLWESRPGDLRERLVQGHHLIIHIPPGVAHALRNPGPEPLYLLAWREGEGSAPEDTVPYLLG